MEPNVEINKIPSKKPSFFGIITSPTVQFERMKEEAPIGLPLFFMMVLLGIAGALGAYVSLKNPMIKDLPQDMPIPVGVTVGLGAVGAIFGGVILFFIIAAFYKLCMVFMSNDTPYMKLFAIILYSSLISSIGVFINGVIALATGGYDVSYTSLAPLVGDNKMLKAIAGNFDIFDIWYYVVLGIGLKTVAGLSKNKAIALVVVVFLLTLALSLVGGLIPTPNV